MVTVNIWGRLPKGADYLHYWAVIEKAKRLASSWSVKGNRVELRGTPQQLDNIEEYLVKKLPKREPIKLQRWGR